ncbi:MAG: type II secretion system protein [Acidobacteriota bacterium]|jgi:general secretion pathway protein G|nr:MAG: general secretion pathway protein GspG [Acidobacteriota bacterium]
MRRWFLRTSPGYSFVELVVATAVMMILASAALPIARVSIRRQKEAELRQALREMRTAIDEFKRWADAGRISTIGVSITADNYPPSLEVLVEGVPYTNDASDRRKKFLRRIPADPITGRADWGLRAYTDPPDATTWGGDSVFDVYSKAPGVGLNGVPYRDW